MVVLDSLTDRNGETEKWGAGTEETLCSVFKSVKSAHHHCWPLPASEDQARVNENIKKNFTTFLVLYFLRVDGIIFLLIIFSLVYLIDFNHHGGPSVKFSCINRPGYCCRARLLYNKNQISDINQPNRPSRPFQYREWVNFKAPGFLSILEKYSFFSEDLHKL